MDSLAVSDGSAARPELRRPPSVPRLDAGGVFLAARRRSGGDVLCLKGAYKQYCKDVSLVLGTFFSTMPPKMLSSEDCGLVRL